MESEINDQMRAVIHSQPSFSFPIYLFL
jgi:hypothetical protein